MDVNIYQDHIRISCSKNWILFCRSA